MTSSKTTKRALFSSALAMVMCVAMLIGTTFAWFTDTASTSVNKIQAGTLDVALEMWSDTQNAWVSAEGESLDFVKLQGHENEEILWEPGCKYELPTLRIANKGNLALKYKVVITGIKGDAKLNEVIDWTIKDGDEIYNVDNEKSLIKGESRIFTIAGTMQTTAGNEYQGLSIDGISITVVATQYNYEYDSNNNTYDGTATYPIVNLDANSSAEDIEAKINEAVATGTDRLTVNVQAATTATTVTLNATVLQKIDNMTVNLGENIVLDMKDHSRGENDIRDRYIVQDGQTLKITGKGTIGSSDYFGACGGATLIIENEGGFVQRNLGNAMINVAAHGANVVIRNYSMGNTYSVHPLIMVGDGVSADNGKTEPSKITLENVAMSNFYFDETRPGAPRAAGGTGIGVYAGSVDVTTSNVTFNGSSVLTSERGSSYNADNAFLAIRNVAGNTATLNGESK